MHALKNGVAPQRKHIMCSQSFTEIWFFFFFFVINHHRTRALYAINVLWKFINIYNRSPELRSKKFFFFNLGQTL